MKVAPSIQLLHRLQASIHNQAKVFDQQLRVKTAVKYLLVWPGNCARSAVSNERNFLGQDHGPAGLQ